MFDLSYLTHIPNISIFAPSTTEELSQTLKYALSLNKPVAIRYPKSGDEKRPFKPYSDGLWERLIDGEKVNILAVGPKMVSVAKQVAS